MKKIIKNILGIVAVCSLFLATGETDVKECQLVWTGSWMLVSLVSAVGMNSMMTDKEKEGRV